MLDRIKTLAERSPLQSLKPIKIWNEELDAAIAADAGKLTGLSKEAAPSAVPALRAGLHLWNDSLDVSHTISQDIDTPTGSYWHGIMHRMEGDYWNSKYWMRRVGSHSVFADLQRSAVALLSRPGALERVREGRGKDDLTAIAGNDRWDPYRFVDAVQRQLEEVRDEEAIALLERIQWHEIDSLIRYCYREATGESLPAWNAEH